MKFLTILIILSLSLYSFARVTKVKSYTTKKGTYVQSHVRSHKNKSKIDNWSHKGNVNPYTGKQGTKE